MLINSDICEIPLFKTSRFTMKLISQTNFSNKINLCEAIDQNNILQLVAGMLYNSITFPVPVTLYLPKSMSPIEVFNIPTVRALICICNEAFLLLDHKNSVIGIRISKLNDTAYKSYLSLINTNKLDICIQAIFRPSTINMDITKRQLHAFKLQDDSIEDRDISIKFLLDNALYLFLVSEAMRNKTGAYITLFGWSKHEIECNMYFINLLKLFRNVYFLGYGNNDEDWLSINLIVSKPYEHINSLDSF